MSALVVCLILGLEYIGPEPGCVLVGLLRFHSGLAEVKVEQFRSQSFTEDGVGRGDPHPHIPTWVLGQEHDRPGG